ncbi:hypothetical protein C1H46_020926 [Malus baccata]|uniref:Uncharacterized protein n=1 Tax=Malus baccata TaxID=106549 RepID=A0A540M434_MALBA|nr:hypothetical protein C1H46_020926 [Malus baccata]
MPRPFSTIVKALSSPLPSCCNELAVRRKWICKSKSLETFFSTSMKATVSTFQFERRRRTCALGWRLRCGRGIARFCGTGFQGLDFGFKGMVFLRNRFMEGIEVVGEGSEKLGRGGEVTFYASRSSKNFSTRFIVTTTSVPIGRYGDETTLF